MNAEMPRDLDAEKAVLGSILIDGTALATVRGTLRAEHFDLPAHALTFRAAVALEDRGTPIDMLTIRAELERTNDLGKAGGVDALLDLSLAVPTAVSVAHYARIVVECAQRRATLGILEVARRRAMAGEMTAEEIADATTTDLFAATSARRTATSFTQSEACSASWEEISRAQDSGSGVTGIASTFTALDRITTGWHPGDLTVLAARTGVGKSTLAVHLARDAAANGHSVVFVTMEMTRTALVKRMIASSAILDEFDLRTGRLDVEDTAQAARTLDGLSQLPIGWIEEGSLTVSELRLRVRLLVSQGKCDLLVVDQLGNLRAASSAREGRTQQVGEFSNGLKRLAVDCGIPVIALHQLNREGDVGESQRPELRHLRDSGTVEQDADVVLLMHRPWKTRDGVSEGEIDVEVAKNRRGSCRSVKLNYYGRQTRFTPCVVPWRQAS